MPIYQYSAKDKSGKTVMGALEVPSEVEVANLLHLKELVIVSVKEVKKKAVIKAKGKKIKLDDLVIFSRQLATMIDAGIPLVQALGILGEQIENKGLKAVVVEVR